MTKRTKYRTKPDRVSTSTLKKSVAAIAPQWAFRKVSHDIPFLRIGSNPFSSRIRLIVFRPISCPRLSSAPSDSGVAPARVLSSHPEDQVPDFDCSSRTAGLSALAPVVLSCDQLPVPSEQGVWCHQGLDLGEPFSADLLGLRGETSALLVGESQSFSAQLLPQGSVFLLEILGHVLLVATDPACEDQHQELQRQSVHRVDSRAGSSSQRWAEIEDSALA